MSFWFFVAAFWFLISVLLVAKLPAKKTVEVSKTSKMDPRRSWYVYVEPTGDPNIYRGVYEKDGRRIYEVEASGITNTLEKLAHEIHKP